MDLKYEQHLQYREDLIRGRETSINIFWSLYQYHLPRLTGSLRSEEIRTVIDYASERYTNAFKNY